MRTFELGVESVLRRPNSDERKCEALLSEMNGISTLFTNETLGILLVSLRSEYLQLLSDRRSREGRFSRLHRGHQQKRTWPSDLPTKPAIGGLGFASNLAEH